MAAVRRWRCRWRRSDGRDRRAGTRRRSTRRRRTRIKRSSTRAGVVRDRGAPRLGAERRRPLLQPRQERLLRRRAASSVCSTASWRSSASTAIPAVQARLAQRPNQGRSGQREQQARLRDLRDGRSEHPDDAVVHQLQGQHGPRSPGLRALRPGVSGMENVDKLYSGYGESTPRGRGPEQGRFRRRATPTSRRTSRSSTTSRRRRSSLSQLLTGTATGCWVLGAVRPQPTLKRPNTNCHNLQMRDPVSIPSVRMLSGARAHGASRTRPAGGAHRR